MVKIEAEKFKLMSKKKIKQIAQEHMERVKRVMKNNNVTEEQAQEAINICCDFSIEHEADFDETLMIICHTIKYKDGDI